MIDYEHTAELLAVDADLSGAVAGLSAGELAFVAEQADTFTRLRRHAGMVRFGAMLGLSCEQEQARRAVRQAATDAQFAEITARRPDGDGVVSDLPPWSGVS